MPVHATLDETGKVPTEQMPEGQGGVTIEDVKLDTDIADSLSLKHSNATDHAPGSDDQDLDGKVDKVTGSSLVADTEIAKIHANTLDHSNSLDHAAGSDNQDLSGKSDVGHDHDLNYEPINSNIQTHVGSAHAPSGAQANADITKAEIEAKLTGELSSHSHAGGVGGLTHPQILARTLGS